MLSIPRALVFGLFLFPLLSPAQRRFDGRQGSGAQQGAHRRTAGARGTEQTHKPVEGLIVHVGASTQSTKRQCPPTNHGWQRLDLA
jgi:hypothetical protein